jgi:UDP-galactopyranose mutase
MKRALVLGGGFAGCTWAYLLAGKGWSVTLFERDPILGGGCRTHTFGGHPYTLGPRHLFTPHPRVFEFLNALVPLRRLHHYLLTYVEGDGQFYSYPIHKDDIDIMPDRGTILAELANRPDPGTAKNFEEYWIYSVGETLYRKFVRDYSKKMWQIESNVELTAFKFDGKGVGLQTGSKEVRPEYDVAYPIKLNGWDDFFDIAAAQPGVEVRCSTKVEAVDVMKPAVRVGGEWIEGDLMISSISPDILLDHQYGELPYIGRELLKLVLPVEHIVPDPIFFLHYANGEVFTRVVEYKKLTGYQAPTTLLGIEIPSRRNKLYPYPIKEEQDKADRYRKAMPDHVRSVGRMGNYRYFDIGDVVNEALTFVDTI